MKIKRIVFSFLCLTLMATMNGCSEKDLNTLVIGVSNLSGTFNPAYSTTIYDANVNSLVYDSLLSRDYEGNTVPKLAESLPTISDDKRTLTFKLKNDVYFSNGKLVTAEDVAFSFKVLADPSYDGRYNNTVANIEGYDQYNDNSATDFSGIKVIDKFTISFTFKEAYRNNIDSVASMGVLPKMEYPKYKKGNLEPLKQKISEPIGSGPYILKSWNNENGVVLEKNKYYKREGYVIESILLKPINTETGYSDLKANNIDCLFDIKEPSIISSASNNKDLKLNAYPGAGISWLTFNCEAGVTSDINVRKALTLAFDRQAFVDSYFNCERCKEGTKELAYLPQILQNPISLLKDEVLNKNAVAGLDANAYDVAQANKILDDAGWIKAKDGIRYKDNQKLSIKLMVSNQQKVTTTLIPIWKKQWMEQLGCDLIVATIDFNSIIAKAMNDDEINDWNAFMISSSFSSDDPGAIYTMFHSSSAGNGGDNFARIRNPKIDALLEVGRVTFNEEEMKDIYLELAKLVSNEYADIPLYITQNFDIYNKRIDNLKTNSYYPWTSALKDAKLKK